MQRTEGREELIEIKKRGLRPGSEMRPEREVGPGHVGAHRPAEILTLCQEGWKATEGFHAVE